MNRRRFLAGIIAGLCAPAGVLSTVTPALPAGWVPLAEMSLRRAPTSEIGRYESVRIIRSSPDDVFGVDERRYADWVMFAHPSHEGELCRDLHRRDLFSLFEGSLQ